MHGDDRLAVAHVAVNEPRHDLVALRVEPPLGARLRHAVGELPVAQVVVRRDGDLLPDRSIFVFDGFFQSTWKRQT